MVFPRPLPSLQNYITWAMLGRRALPYDGGFLDQPPDLLEDFRVIAQEEAEYNDSQNKSSGKKKGRKR